MDPDSLSDEKWAQLYQEYVWVKKYELDKLKSIITEAVNKGMGAR